MRQVVADQAGISGPTAIANSMSWTRNFKMLASEMKKRGMYKAAPPWILQKYNLTRVLI
jgi:hypothetical protein